MAEPTMLGLEPIEHFELSPEARAILTRCGATFPIEAVTVLSSDGDVGIEVLQANRIVLVMPVQAHEFDAMLADERIAEMINSGVVVVLVFERRSDALRLGVILQGGGTA